MPLQVGQVVEGVVSGITRFGAFVQLDEACTGMVHISEVVDAYVRDIGDHLAVGDQVKVKVLSIDEAGKIALSIRRVQETPAAPRPPAAAQQASPPSGPLPATFEDKLSKYLKESEERLLDVRRHSDHRRGYARRG